MEVAAGSGRSLLLLMPPKPPPPPPQSHHCNHISNGAATATTTASLALPHNSSVSSNAIHFSTLINQHHQRNRSCTNKDDKLSNVMLDTQKVNDDALDLIEGKHNDFKDCIRYFEQNQLLLRQGFSYISPPSSKTMEFGSLENSFNKDDSDGIGSCDALSLAKKAMIATQAAATLVENSITLEACPVESKAKLPSLIPEKPTVKSGRRLERQSKRRAPKKLDTIFSDISRPAEISMKSKKNLDSSDPLRLFMSDPETKKLLTLKQERELFVQIQDLMRLEEVKTTLHFQFSREPTMIEWAEAVGMTCRDLQSCIDSGNRCRERMILANFRLVVHVAKHYQKKGLSLQDLLQVGSMGLMKSLGKFKPKAGCRFPTYAYWWIRQSIKKSIFQNSRTIRLPENVFLLLKQINTARRSYIHEEGCSPSNEDLAKRTGMKVEKLERLLITTRTPVSLQQCIWTEQDVTFQETTADPKVEIPELFVAKQMMRRHTRNLLQVLPLRERQIIQFRYGLDGSRQKTLTDIGIIFGISKERIRQLENRALDKLKDCLQSQGLSAYVDLLV